MSAIFLSASVPLAGRRHDHERADPFAIQFAVRELVIAVIERQRIVWGGHPTITAMLSAICKDLNVNYAKSMVLYQSRFFREHFPEDNKHFADIVFVDAVPGDREASLLSLREAMLSRDDLAGAVFIGGMEGVASEYTLFKRFHPNVTRYDGHLTYPDQDSAGRVDSNHQPPH
jgi:hypothetical protein